MISASAISLFKRCQRRALFKYNEQVHVPEQETEALRIGKEGHAILEAYHQDGTAPPNSPLGELCRKGLAHLPPPRTGQAEGKFEIIIGGVPYLGYVDLSLDDHTAIPGTVHEGRRAVAVVDYKFSKSPEKYGIVSPEDFLNDPQALLYAAHAMVQQQVDLCYLRWVKFKTQGQPKAYPVSRLVTRKEVSEAFRRVVHPYAQELVQLRLDKRDPNTVAPNRDACHDHFTPCPYLAYCNPDPVEVDVSNDLLGMLEGLMSAPSAPVSATAPTEPPPPPAAINPPKDPFANVQVTKAPASLDLTSPPPPNYPKELTNPSAVKVLLEELGEAFTRAAKRVA